MAEDKKIQIMLVDDDPFLLDMYGLKFKNKGYDVLAHLKSEDALNELKEGISPDVIILDVIMPKIDGIAMLKQIRDNKYAPDATVIMLTNQSQPEDVEKAEEFGIDGYIVKALTIPSEVVEQVQSIYNKKNKK
jgi:two-component system, sensor histidine kinase and response regulator